MVPENLRTPGNRSVIAETKAIGVQIYECNAQRCVDTV